jgi:hypothetical protein
MCKEVLVVLVLVVGCRKLKAESDPKNTTSSFISACTMFEYLIKTSSTQK